jgi:hypothetical protein
MNASSLMTWLKMVLNLTPYVVAGIEKIHGDSATGASKKQMAQDALGIATAGALDVDPSDTTLIQASSSITGLVIDKTVSDFNAKGTFTHAGPPAGSPPAPTQARPGVIAPPSPAVVEGPGLHMIGAEQGAPAQ